MIRVDRWYRENCTVGIVSIGNYQCFSLELPDKQNIPYESCIPAGKYQYKYRKSNKNGQCLELQNVPNRTYIQIHSANYTSELQGCIAIGDAIRFLNNDRTPDVSNSVSTLSKILELAGESGTIQIS